MNKIAAVYTITCRATGKVYVGRSINYKLRVCQHKSHLRLGKHSNVELLSDFNQFGESCFAFAIYQLTESYAQAVLLERQMISWLQTFHTAYNITSLADPEPESLRYYLRLKADEFGSMRKLAHHWGVSTGFVDDVDKGKRPPPQWILDELGLERIVTVAYRPKDSSDATSPASLPVTPSRR